MHADPTHQLSFAKSLLPRIDRGNLKSVERGTMTHEQAKIEHDTMTAIIATIERQVILAEVSEDMAAMAKRINEVAKL